MRMWLWLAVAAMQVGADASVQRGKLRPPEPVGNQGDWFPADSYPADARRLSEQGRVSVAVMVGPDGRPTACTVESSSGSGSLDATTCDLAMANARFKPALDRRGRPTAGRFTMRNVVWMLDGPGIEVGEGSVALPVPTIVTTIDAEGRTTGCHALNPDGSRGASCPPSMIGQKPGPIAKRNGVAVPGLITQKMSMTIEAIDKSQP